MSVSIEHLPSRPWAGTDFNNSVKHSLENNNVLVVEIN